MLLSLFVIALFSTVYSEEDQKEEVAAYESVHKAIEKCIKDGHSAIDELTTWINSSGTKTTARALAVSIFNNRRWSQKIVDLSYENI